ncbi:MAG TPA: DUF2950 family protein [Bryobacteraceae bacterium]|nr:DUF2950 family protein [Bryobacteraceae bacterium]
MNAKTFAVIFVLATGAVFAQASKSPAKSQAPKSQAPKQRTFDSPEAATKTLIDAAAQNDTATLAAILGSSARGILTSGDTKEDQSERAEFARIANEKHQIEKSTVNAHVRILVVGDQQWPFPIPLIEEGQRWRFDPARGAMEMRARLIGEDELDAIGACAAYVTAQQAYAAKKRTPAGTEEYAQTISSLSVPQRFAEAAEPSAAKPYHGYYFRVLKAGEHPWVVGKVMMGGFGLVAWPAQYGVTGIHTFLVNQDGVVFEKDRGAKTTTPLTRYEVNDSWKAVD